MKCPRCGVKINDALPKCEQCGFSLDDLASLAGKAPPERLGFVNDYVGKINAKTAKLLESELAAFKAEVGPEVVLAVVQNTHPLKPSEYVFWLHNAWDLGGEQNLGILFLIALDERRVESEVGYGLEHIFTDEESEKLLVEVMVPYLAKGDFSKAAEQGAKALIAFLIEYAEAHKGEVTGETTKA